MFSGANFPTNDINPGDFFYNTSTGAIYRYLGGNPTLSASWFMTGGILTSDPDTTGWGSAQAGSQWFNKTDMQFRGWNGSQIVVIG